ncbi:four-carbon acid sugar kinase family protein [Rhizobium sp. XQZ8]|uniref:four-carbon acid sugar kinase family protein n=1 Tax=Rhizobium populisoli TaxID=2859785 RepID=UPI001CA5E753|nr:four-carbon acid sugar kinase family protein [Rhizobium populisoli]MBW6422129.1 four-carbon acid sugar kinase family protein [Rhizobium populisoli]
MGITVAIIADDLTGALDTGTPFVAAGLSVAVAVDVENIPSALRSAPDVLVVNTASRALSPQQASARVGLAAIGIAMAKPAFVFKKIDSRLKGNVAVESEALARAFGYRKLVVAPAIPDQQRFTRGGAVTGRGVETPLPILPFFAGPGADLIIADAQTDEDLDRILADHDWSDAVAVGARGLGLALARKLRRPGARPAIFRPSSKTLFAIGSRDPITEAQMEALTQSGRLASVLHAPSGALPDRPDIDLPALLRCTGDMTEDSTAVANRFGRAAHGLIQAAAPDTVITGGGDTALALLRILKAGVLIPKGEIEPGVPWCEILLENGRQIRVAVKSGGFGTPQTLIKAIETAPETRQAV